MKRNKFIFLALLAPLLMSNSPAPIPYIEVDRNYSNYRIDNVVHVLPEVQEDEPVEGEGEEEEETPVAPSYVYTFTITNNGNFALDDKFTFIVDEKFEFTRYFDFENEVVLPKETKTVTFDLSNYVAEYGDFEFTKEDISATEAVAHKYNVYTYDEVEIRSRAVSEDRSSTTFDLKFTVPEEKFYIMYVGVEVTTLENGRYVTKVYSDSDYNKIGTSIYTKITVPGEKNNADIGTPRIQLFKNENKSTGYGDVYEDMFIPLLISVILLGIGVIAGLIALIVSFHSSKKEKDDRKEMKRLEKERVEREKEEKRKAKEEKKRIKEMEKNVIITPPPSENNNNEGVLFSTTENTDNNGENN